ncbi:hypothetical protein HOLleu_06250 [Holothuria leucospilota]|uniref:Uncharacterized protein n=1 Tax=Holothuria leucospilota TaxID=206669 RepID=A0A9Q1CL70_HOLLE|nr:hypothetical protein HOLleu_06250 [Holothuria leucospilota]
MWKYFTANNTLKYIGRSTSWTTYWTIYNRSHHRSIGMAPRDGSPKNSLQVLKRLYPAKQRTRLFLFEIADTVRISMVARPFLKGYLPRWTEELFNISQCVPRHAVFYQFKDWEDEWVESTFFEAELQPESPKA